MLQRPSGQLAVEVGRRTGRPGVAAGRGPRRRCGGSPAPTGESRTGGPAAAARCEHVEHRRPRPPGVERGQQRVLVDQRPRATLTRTQPGRIRGQERLVHEALGGRGGRRASTMTSASPTSLEESVGGHGAGRRGPRGTGVRRQPMTRAPKARAADGHLAPDVPSPTISHVVPATSRQSWIRHAGWPPGTATAGAPGTRRAPPAGRTRRWAGC